MTCNNEEASDRGGDLMDVDIADASNGCVSGVKEGLLLWPVLPQEYGEGLPYAPANWPSPGDMWGWKVGKRIAASGYHMDRYLYLPARFQRSRRKREGFASKLSVEQYIKTRFPDTDINAFFSSFSWKIPFQRSSMLRDDLGSIRIPTEERPEQSLSDSLPGAAACKAGNKLCSSLLQDEISAVTVQPCEVCCPDPRFCRECCCILCSHPIDSTLGGYSFIRCETTTDDDLICGHVAHINCALRSYMAGKVGGSIALDTEYYCRLCDKRMDLTKHVTNIWKMCESIESRVDIEKMLNVCSLILRGSQKRASQKLLSCVESALEKLKAGDNLEEVWKVDVDVVTVPTGKQLDYINYTPPEIGKDNFLHQNEYLKLEGEIDEVLQGLRKSQELEYRLAQEKLHSQKDYIFRLYQHMEEDKSKLTQLTPGDNNRDALLSSVVVQEQRIQCELNILSELKKVAKGFGNISKDILINHFDLDVDD